MPRTLVLLSFSLFLLTALTGLVMRAFPLTHNHPIPYEHLLHGHSHLALIGWAFMGVLVVFLAVIWSHMTSKEKRHSMMLTSSLFTVSMLMFAAFLYEGYALYSIILSTLHIGVEYWAVIFIYRRLRYIADRSKTAALFVKAALVTLIISTVGPFVLGAISANGLQETAWFDMAIYFYLHFQYNGWLFFMLMAMLIFLLVRRGIPFNHVHLRSGFWIYLCALFPGYILSILWVEALPWYSYIPAITGSIGQWIGIFLIICALSKSWTQIKLSFPGRVVWFLGGVLFLLFVKSTLELGLMMPNLANMIYETRSIVIGYLHLTLLGFVSSMILVLYQITGLLDSRNNAMFKGVGLFAIGLILNEGILFLQGLFDWMNLSAVPFAVHGLLAAALLLFLGIISMTVSIFTRQSVFRFQYGDRLDQTLSE